MVIFIDSLTKIIITRIWSALIKSHNDVSSILRWISITFSAEKKCLDPSICDLKVTPSSAILQLAEREYT